MHGRILFGVMLLIVLELWNRFLRGGFHRCVACRRIIWPWQTRAVILSSSVIAEGHYHNTIKRACLKWPEVIDDGTNKMRGL